MKDTVKRVTAFNIIAICLLLADLIWYIASIFSSYPEGTKFNLSIYSSNIIPKIILIVALVACSFAKNKILLQIAFSIVAYENICSLWSALESSSDMFFVFSIIFRIFAALIMLVCLMHISFSAKTDKILIAILGGLSFVCSLCVNFFLILYVFRFVFGIVRHFIYSFSYLFIGLGLFFEYYKKEWKEDA